VPQPTRNAAKKRPIPTRRSPVVKGGKMPAPAHAGAEDDVKISALKLPPGTLSPEAPIPKRLNPSPHSPTGDSDMEVVYADTTTGPLHTLRATFSSSPQFVDPQFRP